VLDKISDLFLLLPRTFKDYDGIGSDQFEVDVRLSRHMPDQLPIDGKRISFYYPGIKKVCNRCFKCGHIKKECNEPKGKWIDFVHKLYLSNKFTDSMFGKWIEELDKAGKLKEESTPERSKEHSDASDDSLLDSPKRKKADTRGRSVTKAQPKKKKGDLRFELDKSKSRAREDRSDRDRGRDRFQGQSFRGRGRGRGNWRGRGRSNDRRDRREGSYHGPRDRSYGPRDGFYPVRNSQPYYRR